MHGPRLSGAKREWHKTVTFHEICEVVEFSRDEDESGEVFESDEDDNYGNAAEEDVDFFGEGKNEETPHDSYEDIELSDQEPEVQLELDADTSITGLVDEIFAGSHQTSTPRRHHPNEPPPDLETEDGVPLGQTHHADRVMKYYQEHESHHFVKLARIPSFTLPPSPFTQRPLPLLLLLHRIAIDSLRLL
ncbi:hypothetical protein F5879DRAFT_992341 [Lentinula edodes]|nr:hypothetical protein F5879DRAFT_992341 [Lentinula edodes]